MGTKNVASIQEKIAELGQSEILIGLTFLFATAIFLLAMVWWAGSVIMIFPTILWLTAATGVFVYMIRCHKLRNNLIKELEYATPAIPIVENKEAIGEDPSKVITRFTKEETFSLINYWYGNFGGSRLQFRPAQVETFSLYDYWCGNW